MNKSCQNCKQNFLIDSDDAAFYEQMQEQYRKALDKFQLGSFRRLQEIKQRFGELKLQVPRKYAQILKSENVLGDDILNSRNCYYVFNARGGTENVRYAFRAHNIRDGMDAYICWNGAEVFYETVSVDVHRGFFSAFIWGGFDTWYSYNCFDCNNIFGCVGLKNKSYCILNKQYTPDEYATQIFKVKSQMSKAGEYGEFFPASMSPFGYNETVAQEYYPISKSEAIAQGFGWRDPEAKNYTITKQAGELPDHIKDIDDGILNEIISCVHQGQCHEQCATAFKMVPQELQFYRRFNLPLPRLCPSCRHGQRLKLKNPMKLWHRRCMYEHCPNEFETPYAPDRPELIYCEQHYNSTIL